MRTLRQAAQLFASVTTLFVTMAILPVAAQTFDEAVAAYGRGDFSTALRGFRLAAEQGYASAQFNLGVMYDTDEGVPEDDVEAVRWFRLAAEQGHAGAQFNLGVIYSNGEGVPEDDVEAVRWYRLAAEQGDALAQATLGLMYDTGEGVPENTVKAYTWYSIAAAQGEADARTLREGAAERMTRSQITEGQSLAEELWEH